MVKVNATGQNLVCQETHKTNTGAAFERSGDADNSFVALRFSKGMNADESMLVFESFKRKNCIKCKAALSIEATR
jgi:hypothetical protein